MIESMQSGIRGQSGGGMDPFGGMGSAFGPSTTGSLTGTPTVSQSATYTAASTASPASSASGVTVGAQRVEYATTTTAAAVPLVLDNTPLVSGDAKTVDVIGNKLCALVDAEGNQALDEPSRNTLTSMMATLKAGSAEHSSTIPSEAYAVLGKIMSLYPKQHMNCLFLLRLMVLHENSVPKAGDRSSAGELIESVLMRLSAAEGSPEGFSSAPSRVMALCALANLLSHRTGIAFIFGSNTTGGSEPLANSIVDAAVGGLRHSRAEVRQMSAALAYNFTLACTNDACKDIVPDSWRLHPDNAARVSEGGDISEHELAPHAVQLLCGSLEDIAAEDDSTVKYRRLVVACRIVRAGGIAAKVLGSDLGFTATLVSADFSGEQEKKLSLEMIRAFDSVTN
jgi:hypothetical protein